MRRTSGCRGSTDLPTGAIWALDAAGAVYVADSNTNRIRKITPDGTIATVAGRGLAAYSAPNGTYLPTSTDADGSVTTIAGNGSPGHSGDGVRHRRNPGAEACHPLTAR
jgi:hypothetical protein